MNWEGLIKKVRREQEDIKDQVIRSDGDIEFVAFMRGQYMAFESIIVLINEEVKTEDDG